MRELDCTRHAAERKPKTAVKGYFDALPRHISHDAAISPTEKSILLVIAGHAYGSKSTCWPGTARIAAAVGRSEGQCRRLIAGLVARGTIQRTQVGWSRDNPTGRFFTLPWKLEEARADEREGRAPEAAEGRAPGRAESEGARQEEKGAAGGQAAQSPPPPPRTREEEIADAMALLDGFFWRSGLNDLAALGVDCSALSVPGRARTDAGLARTASKPLSQRQWSNLSADPRPPVLRDMLASVTVRVTR